MAPAPPTPTITTRIPVSSSYVLVVFYQHGIGDHMPTNRVESPESGKRDEWREAPPTGQREGRGPSDAGPSRPGKRTLTPHASRLTPVLLIALLFCAWCVP